MTHVRKAGVVVAVGLGITAAAWAQMMMQQPPRIPGEFRPVAGTGAEYEITSEKTGKTDFVYAVVGKENVQGAEGYWLEIRTEGGKAGGMIVKQLMVVQAGKPDIKRMIMQAPGQPPMEIPVGMMSGMMSGMMKRGQQSSAEAEGGMGDKVGTEAVSVPAGTFVCDHYKHQSGKTKADIWISSKVAPYGLVKMVSEDTTMVLQKVLTNETSHITGTPRKIEMPQF